MAKTKDALKILDSIGFVRRIVIFHSLKKACRRKLLRITHDYYLLPPRNSPNSIPNGNLGGLIEDHEIKRGEGCV